MLLAAVGFGTLGPLSRFAADAGVSALTFSTWRSAVAVAVLVTLLLSLVRSRQATLVPWRDMPSRDQFQLASAGAFVAGTSLFLFLAFERIPIPLALIFYYTYPSAVAFAATRVHHEPLTRDRVLSIGLATGGLALVLLAPQQDRGAGLDVLGVAFALLAGCCQGAYALVSARGFRSAPSFQAATLIRVAAMLVAIVVVVPLLAALGRLADLWQEVASPAAWGPILLAGTIGAGLPAVALVVGYRRVGSVIGAILMIFEPVVGVVLAMILFGERPAPLQLLGGVLVLAGAALAAMAPRVTAHGAPIGPIDPGPFRGE